MIIGLASCPEDEANADIQESLDQVGKGLSGRIDSVYVKEGEPGCGYKFINGSHSKLLEGAYTDVDLMEEVNGFFELRQTDGNKK